MLYQDVAIDEASGLRGSRRFEQMVLAELEAAYDRLHALLGLEPPRPIDVVIYDPAIFDRQFAGLFPFRQWRVSCVDPTLSFPSGVTFEQASGACPIELTRRQSQRSHWRRFSNRRRTLATP